MDDAAFNYEGHITVPKNRLAVIIGKNGSTKRRIERELKASLSIDDQTVFFSTKDPLSFMNIRDVIKAIARGFTPDEALLLKSDNITLYIINLEEKFGKNEDKISRYKARLIGRQGTVRKQIEEGTNVKMVIYGKTVSLIGNIKDIKNALDVINILLKGGKHHTAFKVLQKQRFRKQ